MESEPKGEMIIVRRSGNSGEEECRSGIWKIAYADFMTAMMAFFLVMWLINAISEEKKIAIAHYFTPIRLFDSQTGQVGLRDLKKNAIKNRKAAKDGAPASGGKTPEMWQERLQENLLMEFPFEALDTIVNIMPEDARYSYGQNMPPGDGRQHGSRKGTAYRDPFSPEYWSRSIPAEMTVPPGSAGKGAVSLPVGGMPGAGQKKKSLSGSGQKTSAREKAAADVLAGISAEIAALMRDQQMSDLPQVHVSLVDGVISIELTDSQNYGMFDVGSARPERQLVMLLQGMARILAEHKGEVVIGGYTDSRPYKTLHYDNWQLSTARAQIAHYILVRGGLDESRILRVEGYADRQLKNRADPYAAENRRIAIFLRLPKEAGRR